MSTTKIKSRYPKDANGKPLTPSNIKSWQKTFEKYGNSFKSQLSETGEGFLEFAFYQNMPCGCRVIGNGSLVFPLTVKQCATHRGMNARARNAARRKDKK